MNNLFLFIIILLFLLHHYTFFEFKISLNLEGNGFLLKRLILKCLCFYKCKISPIFPLRCRYIPTCSQYTLEAVENFGVFKGVLLGLWRFLRCNVFFKGGFDPVEIKELKNDRNKEV